MYKILLTFKCKVKSPAVTRHGGDYAEVKTRHLRPAVFPQRYPRPSTLVHGPTFDHFYLAKDRRVELACKPNSGMVHCRFTINRHIDQQHCLFRPSQDMGEQENNIYFRGTRE